MVKFREASPGAAYVIAEGVTDAEEAAKLGLAVVESTADGRPAHYGKYKDAPGGGPLGITVDRAADTDVIAGGGVSANADAAPVGNQKGSLINPDDPFVRQPGEESIHADGAAPGVVAEEEDETPLREAAEKSIEQASKTSKKK